MLKAFFLKILKLFWGLFLNPLALEADPNWAWPGTGSRSKWSLTRTWILIRIAMFLIPLLFFHWSTVTNSPIEVSRAGLPVDMTTLPVPPQMQVKIRLACKSSEYLSLWQSSEYLSELRMLVRAQNTCQSSEYLSELRILVRAQNTCQSSEYLSELRILVTAENTCHSSEYLSELRILVTAQNTCHSLEYLSELIIIVRAYCWSDVPQD